MRRHQRRRIRERSASPSYASWHEEQDQHHNTTTRIKGDAWSILIAPRVANSIKAAMNPPLPSNCATSAPRSWSSPRSPMTDASARIISDRRYPPRCSGLKGMRSSYRIWRARSSPRAGTSPRTRNTRPPGSLDGCRDLDRNSNASH